MGVGCGSATPPPESPADEASTEEPVESRGALEDEGEAREAPAAEEPDTAAAEAAPEPLSDEEIGIVLQAVLDDPELDRYLQTKRPGRVPVKVSGEDLPRDVKAAKGGYPVKVVDGPKSPKDPVLVIVRLERSGNVVTVAYRYDVEGIRGTTRIKKGTSGWELVSSRVMQ
jgi:hypothetical protein